MIMAQNEYEKIVKAMADKGVPHWAFELLADLRHNEVMNSESLDHDKYYDAYHELKDAAIALVEILESDKDVKENNWWLNERAKIMEVIDEIDDGGCVQRPLPRGERIDGQPATSG